MYQPQDYWDFWKYYVVEPFFKTSFVDNSKLITIMNEKLGTRPWQRKFCF